MKQYAKQFFLRGLVFGGFGPIILGIIYAFLQVTLEDFSVNGLDICLGIASTYLLAFVQAGASVFNQIEEWSLPKSLLCHFSLLYLTYVLCYLGNTWIPFVPAVILIFTAIFVGGYFLIWGTVYTMIKLTSRRLNSRLA